MRAVIRLLKSILISRHLMMSFFALILLLGHNNSFATVGLKIDKPYLFAIEKNGQISFVFGTVHTFVENSQFPDYLISAIESRPVFFGESNPKDAFQIRKSSERNNLHPVVIQSFKKRGVPIKDILYADPSQLCSIYTQWDLVKENNYSRIMDSRLHTIAKNNGSQILALDTNKELLAEAKKQLMPCDNARLNSIVMNYPPERISAVIKQSYEAAFQEYVQGEIIYLTDKDEVSTTIRRNVLWMNHLLSNHQQGFFAAMGAHHLAPGNPYGILPMLKKNGFKITRITNKKALSDLFIKYKIYED